MADLLHRSLSTPEAGIAVVAVGADRDAPGLEAPRSQGVDTFLVDFAEADSRDAWADTLADTVESYSPDLVVLSGLMRLVPPGFVRRFDGRLINTHPSFLPDFPGPHAVADQLKAGVEMAGASIIAVDDGVDTGPVIVQQRVSVEPGDTAQTLHTRIKQTERQLLWDLVVELSSGERTLPLQQK